MYTLTRSLTYPSLEFDRASERKIGANADIFSNDVVSHEVHRKHTAVRNAPPLPNVVKYEARHARTLSTQTQASTENLGNGPSQELTNCNHPRYVFLALLPSASR